MSGPRTPRQHPSRPAGFTLIEAALVTCIIGFGVVSMLQLLAAGTMSNVQANELTTGLTLANNIREVTQNLAFCDPINPLDWGPEDGETLATYNDVDDFDKAAFSPPIDARRKSLSTFTGWTQSITVQSVDPNRLTLVVPAGTTPMNKVTVTVTHKGKPICTLSWIVVKAT